MYDVASYKRCFIYIYDDISNIYKDIFNNFSIVFNGKNFGNIYYSDDISVKFFSNKNNWCVLIGTFIDTYNLCTDDIDYIAGEILKKIDINEDTFYEYVEYLNGRYAILYSNGDKINIINDATGMRSVWYCINKRIISSHYPLIQNIINESESEMYSLFKEITEECHHNKKMAPWCLPGDLSPYHNIKMLISNHVLCINDMKIKRFWPNKNIDTIDIKQAALYISDIIKKQAEFLTDKYTIIQSITAGNDSRLSLAAVKNVKDKIIFFVYNLLSNIKNNKIYNYSYNQASMIVDYNFAKDVARVENLNFIELDCSKELNIKDKNIINSQHYHHHIVGVLQDYKDKLPQKAIHIRSNLIEIIRHSYFNYPDDIDDSLSSHMTRWSMYSDCNNYIKTKINKIYEDFIKEQEYNSLYNYNIGDIFYMEYRMNQWMGGAVLIENDIVFDTIMLFNTRKILSIGMSIPKQYKDRNVLVTEIINILWPELLNFFNFPNKVDRNYSLINWNSIESRGVFHFERDIFFKRKYEIISGNSFNKDKLVNAHVEPYLDGITFGFSNSHLYKGDFIKLKIINNIDANTSYYYQFDIFCYYLKYANFDTWYQIIIDDNVIYELPINLYTGRTNQILYLFKNNNKKNQEIYIKIYSKKDIEVYFNGIIDIKNIILRRENFNIDKDIIISSYDNIKELWH